MNVSTTPPANGNPGIVPPWLQKPVKGVIPPPSPHHLTAPCDLPTFVTAPLGDDDLVGEVELTDAQRREAERTNAVLAEFNL